MAPENRTVIGSYSNQDELRDVVNRLVDEGYSKNEITLYANSDTAPSLQGTQGVDVETTSGDRGGAHDHDHESMWEKIKDAFTVGTRDDADYDDEEYGSSEDILLPFRGDLNSGSVVVVVDNYRGLDREKGKQADISGVDVNGRSDVDSAGQLDTNARTAPMAGVSGVEDDENVKTRSGIHHKLDDHDKHFDMGNKNVPTDRRTDKDYSDEYLETQNAAGYKGTDIDGMADNRSDHDLLGRDANDTMDERTDRAVRDDNDEKIRLKEERLNVDKQNVKTGEVDIHKRTVEETRTIDVPVEREEVVIDRKPVKDGEVPAGDFDTDNDTDEIRIPIREEQVEVTKKPVVTEEVDIHKEKKHDTKHVSEEVRREELDVDTEGNVEVEGGNDHVARDYDTDKDNM